MVASGEYEIRGRRFVKKGDLRQRIDAGLGCCGASVKQCGQLEML